MYNNVHPQLRQYLYLEKTHTYYITMCTLSKFITNLPIEAPQLHQYLSSKKNPYLLYNHVHSQTTLQIPHKLACWGPPVIPILVLRKNPYLLYSHVHSQTALQIPHKLACWGPPVTPILVFGKKKKTHTYYITMCTLKPLSNFSTNFILFGWDKHTYPSMWPKNKFNTLLCRTYHHHLDVVHSRVHCRICMSGMVVM